MDENRKQKTILVVDDSFANRMLLLKIFSEEYHVEQAENGKQALDILYQFGNSADEEVAAIVLDIQMPEIDGYDVLETLRADERLRDIPVVVNTGNDDVDSQLKSLDLGAVDVLVKPFNPQIALHRIRNIITRREADKQAERNRVLEQLLRQSEIDEKTGLYNKHAFCRKTAELLRENAEEKYVLIRWDVDRFKVFNDVFGVRAGDQFLAQIGKAYQEKLNRHMTYGHWEADHFVACLPQKLFKKLDVCGEITRLVAELPFDFEFIVRFGLYEVDDIGVDVALMCDRALLALRSIKASYSTRMAYYDQSMRAALLEEQEIVSDMDKALEQGQFVVYLQPQFDYAAKTLHGAEALIRWSHPTKGLIPPDKFIPIFERNGFISKMDEYVWEQACIQLRKWLDAGEQVVPISVNVSRRDIYNPNLCEIIHSLVNKYDLSPTLLRLEITESAYMENAGQLLKTVEKLRALGFAVEMDDFGSGYSSLNTLKAVPVDKLKLDMKFLEDSEGDTKGGSILTSVIRMAHWLRLPVIAEGVETREQAEYLKSVGCLYMQGYYFARPMPIKDFETVLRDKKLNLGMSAQKFNGSIEGAADFLSADTQATLLFNSFVGGASIIEYDGNIVEALRLNDKYFEVLGTTPEAYADKKLNLLARFDDANREIYLSAIRKAIETGEESNCEVCSLPLHEGGGEMWSRTRMRLLAQNENRYILYCAVENITKRMRMTEQLTAIMDSVPGGILDFEVGSDIRIAYFNDTCASMFGYSRKEYEKLFVETPMEVIHADDLAEIHKKADKVIRDGVQTMEAVYRHKCADGTWRWVRLTGHVVKRKGDRLFASGILFDIDEDVKKERVAARQSAEIESQRLSLQTLYDTIPCGIMQFSTSTDKEGKTGLLGLNDTAWQIFGYENRTQYVEAVHGKSKLKDIYPEDLRLIQECIEVLRGSEDGKKIDCDHRIVRLDGSIRWIRALFQKVRYPNNEKVVQVVFTDITDRKQESLQQLSTALFGLYDEVFEIDMEHDICFMRAAKQTDDPRIDKFVPFHRHLDVLCQKFACPEEHQKIRDFYNRAGRTPSAAPEVLEYRYLDAAGEQRWAMSTLLHLSGSLYLTCNRDITEQKNAQRLMKENEVLQALVDERKKEDERNRIFIESTGILMYDYSPDSDTLKLQRKDSARGIIEETNERYIATIDENPAITVADRARVKAVFEELTRAPGNRTIEYRCSRLDGGFSACRAQVVSIADASGKVYRVIGQVSRVQDGQQIELSKKLLEITGSDYKELAYEKTMIAEILRIVEQTEDTASAVQTALETVGQQLNVSRAYIVEEQGDGSHCSNTFEWCNDGIIPEIENLQNYQYPDGMRKRYIQMFDSGGVMVGDDISSFPSWIRAVLEPQGIKAVLQCAMTNSGVFLGFVGFDECTETRSWTEQQIHTIRVITHILSALLFEKHSARQSERSEALKQAIENSPAYSYVIDPDTYQILYTNQVMRAIAGMPGQGDVCYKAFMNRKTVCDICPVRQLHASGVSVPTKVYRNNRCFIMQAAPFLWHGRKALLITGVDSRSFTEDLESALRSEYLNDLDRYTHTLFGLFDEIFEFDFHENAFLPLLSMWPGVCNGSARSDLDAAVERWASRFIDEAERNALLNFLNLKNIQKAFQSGKNPSLEYTVRLSDGTKRDCRSTLLQLDAERYLCCNKDITEQKRAEQLQQEVMLLKAQTETQDRYRIVVEQTGTAVIDMNYQTGEFSCSEAYGKYEASRHSQNALLSNTGDRSLVHPDDQAALQEFFNATTQGMSHTEAVLRLKMIDGSYRWNRMAGTFIRDAGGNLKRVIGTFTDIDEEIRSKIALERLSERMRRIISNIPTGVAIYEVRDKILPIYVSKKTCEMFGFTREEYDLRIANGEPVNYMPDAGSLPPDGIQKMQSGQPLVIQKLRARKKDGSWIWLRAFCSMVENKDGSWLCYAVLADITDEVALEQRYLWQTEKYKLLSESADMITFDYSPQDDIMRISLLLPQKGFTEEVRDRYLETIPAYGRIPDNEKDSFIAVLRHASAAATSGTYDFEGDYYGTGMRWYRAKYMSLADDEGQVYRVIGRLDDIHDIIMMQNQLRTDAQMDEVTGIYNKNYAIAAITNALSEKDESAFDAALFLDIDNFKAINDTYGHLEADKVLQKIGMTLRGLFRENDIVARFGGDEFIVYMKSAGGMQVVTEKAAGIIHAANEIKIGSAAPVCCSIGITGITGRGVSYESVLKRADAALYEAKENGKNQYAVVTNQI